MALYQAPFAGGGGGNAAPIATVYKAGTYGGHCNFLYGNTFTQAYIPYSVPSSASDYINNEYIKIAKTGNGGANGYNITLKKACTATTSTGAITSAAGNQTDHYKESFSAGTILASTDYTYATFIFDL